MTVRTRSKLTAHTTVSATAARKAAAHPSDEARHRAAGQMPDGQGDEDHQINQLVRAGAEIGIDDQNEHESVNKREMHE